MGDSFGGTDGAAASGVMLATCEAGELHVRDHASSKFDHRDILQQEAKRKSPAPRPENPRIPRFSASHDSRHKPPSATAPRSRLAPTPAAQPPSLENLTVRQADATRSLRGPRRLALGSARSARYPALLYFHFVRDLSFAHARSQGVRGATHPTRVKKSPTASKKGLTFSSRTDKLSVNGRKTGEAIGHFLVLR